MQLFNFFMFAYSFILRVLICSRSMYFFRRVNFDPELLRLFREVEAWERVGFSIPFIAMENSKDKDFISGDPKKGPGISTIRFHVRYAPARSISPTVARQYHSGTNTYHAGTNTCHSGTITLGMVVLTRYISGTARS